MNVLVTWGSKHGGTEGLAGMLADALAREGVGAMLAPAATVKDLADFDAVVVGGGSYANRWHRDARHFVRRHARSLREIPVWFFSNGEPTKGVCALMTDVRARGYGALGAPEQARAWAKEIAASLSTDPGTGPRTLRRRRSPTRLLTVIASVALAAWIVMEVVLSVH